MHQCILKCSMMLVAGLFTLAVANSAQAGCSHDSGSTNVQGALDFQGGSWKQCDGSTWKEAFSGGGGGGGGGTADCVSQTVYWGVRCYDNVPGVAHNGSVSAKMSSGCSGYKGTATFTCINGSFNGSGSCNYQDNCK